MGPSQIAKPEQPAKPEATLDPRIEKAEQRLRRLMVLAVISQLLFVVLGIYGIQAVRRVLQQCDFDRPTCNLRTKHLLALTNFLQEGSATETVEIMISRSRIEMALLRADRRVDGRNWNEFIFNCTIPMGSGMSWPQQASESHLFNCVYTFSEVADHDWKITCSLHGVATRTVQTPMDLLRQAAESGFPEPQFEYGRTLLTNDADEQKAQEGAEWLKKAARQGNATAALLLAAHYSLGKPLSKNPVEALAWAKHAAELGNPMGEHCLATFLLNGMGGEQDPAAAVEWLRKAAARGNRDSQVTLGRCLAEGYGVAPNAEEAVRWLEEAAENGSFEAAFILGNIYMTGAILATDSTEAARWFSQAARFGHSGAQSNLGELYRDGRGVPKDLEKAVALFSQALEKDNGVAMANYGACLENGSGIATNPVDALTYYYAAASATHWPWNVGATKQKALEQRLSPEEIDEARDRAGKIRAHFNLFKP